MAISAQAVAFAHFDDVLEQELIATHFQPILSVRKRAVIGYEGLSRGTADTRSGLTPPLTLFHAAHLSDKVLEFDRLCRRKTLERFSETLYAIDDTQLVFMNFEGSLLDDGVLGSGQILDLVLRLGINPHNVVIEIEESKVKDTGALVKFVETHRYYGFMIALDHMGTGHSNFDRISVVKPDIIKINRSLIKNISTDGYKQELFKSLVNFARRMGTLVLGEGIETEEEAICCLRLGADLLQGFYFARPQEVSPGAAIVGVTELVAHVAEQFRTNEIKKIRAIKHRQGVYEKILKLVVERLAGTKEDDIRPIIEETMKDIPLIDAIYILDAKGVQITETIVNARMAPFKNKLFQPAVKGDDHSLKEYYYLLINTDLERFTTDTYISLATGNTCKTISSNFTDDDGAALVLCIDFREDVNF